MSLRHAGLSLCTAAMLAACTTPPTPTQQAALATAGVTLASVAAANSSTVATLVTKGTLFCQTATATGPLVVALATIAGVPVSVTGQAAADVATACGLIGGVAVSPPANPSAAPVVPVATTLPAVS